MVLTTNKLLARVMLFISVLTTFAGPEGAIANPKLTDADRSHIVRSILRRELAAMKLTKRDSVILVKNEFIRPDWLSGLTDVKLVLLSKLEIQRKRKDGFLFYLIFSRFEVKGTTVEVHFGEATSSTSESGPIYEYRKVAGKWKWRFAGTFVSCGGPLGLSR